MSRNDSYHGGSTIIGPGSDWFAGPKKKQKTTQQADAEKPVRKRKTKAEKAQAKAERAKAKQLKLAKRAKAIKAREKAREKEREQLEKKQAPAVKQNPDDVARRLNKPMNNVTVLRKDKRGVPRPIEQAPALNQSSS